MLRIGTWNVGGCKTRGFHSDPSVTRSYDKDNVPYVAARIRELDFDILSIQELQEKDDRARIEEVAHAAGYPYFVYFRISPSHIDHGMSIGNGIISKYPLINARRERLLNPRRTIRQDGATYDTHDKGFISADADVNGELIRITSLHFLPFYLFDIPTDSNLFNAIFLDFDEKYAQTKRKREIIMGDFNTSKERILQLLPSAQITGFKEFPTQVPTHYRGDKSDHILYKGVTPQNKTLELHPALTDHKIITSTFTL